MKKSPIKFAKKTLNAGVNVLGRLHKSASVATLSALRVAKGEKMDAYLLKEAFMQMGVTYIKLGQFIASTPTLFPREYVLAFADCLDSTPPVPFSQICEVLSEELSGLTGKSLEEIFEVIDPAPLASASIAQVHRATLKDGRQVALKVQKSHVQTIMQTDLGVLHSVFWTMERLMPAVRAVNLAPIVDEIRTRMAAETDFLAEARHIDKFHEFLSSAGLGHITAPTVHHKLSTKRVLVMDLLMGESLVDDKLSEMTARHHTTPQKLMSDVLDAWFLSLMKTGEFHADLHAGNLLYLYDGRIAFLDFGLVGQIKPASLQACFSWVHALQTGDYQGMARAMVDIGMTHTLDDGQITRLADDLERMIDKTTHDGHEPEHLSVFMLEMTQIGKRYGIHFPRDFALLTKQLLYFDRFMVTLAPDMELFEGERLQIVQAEH